MNVITNEWMDADKVKPFRLRVVLVRFEDGDQSLGMWNGAYWTNKKGEGRIDRARKVTHFYIYERFIDKNEY
jgi:hypothetical protein